MATATSNTLDALARRATGLPSAPEFEFETLPTRAASA